MHMKDFRNVVGSGFRWKWWWKRHKALPAGKEKAKTWWDKPWGVKLLQLLFWVGAGCLLFYLAICLPGITRFFAGEWGRAYSQQAGMAEVYRDRHPQPNSSPVIYSDGAKVTAVKTAVTNAKLPASATPTWRLAGILPPGSYDVPVRVDFEAGAANSKFFFVAGGSSDQPKTIEALKQEAAEFQKRYAQNPHILTWVLPMPEVSFDDVFHRRKEESSVTVWYVQSDTISTTHSFNTYFTYDSNIGHEVVEVPRKGVTLTLSAIDWDYICIIPIHDQDYQSKLFGRSVPTTGLTQTQLYEAFVEWSVARGADPSAAQKHGQKVAQTYWTSPGYQALLCDGEPFITAKVFDRSEAGTTACLTLNANPADELADQATSCKVRVLWRRSR